MATVEATPPDVFDEVQPIFDRIGRIADEIKQRAQAREPVGEFVQELAEILQRQQDPEPGPVALGQLIESHPKLHEIVVDGFLRRGETENLIAPPKRGKSWLVMGLAFAVAQGRPWLGQVCRQGSVLIVDAELHPATIAHRMRTVAEALEVDGDIGIDVLSLRGENCDLPSLAVKLESINPGTYELVILDALYRFLPAGTSENDNAAMMAVYNHIDQIAKQLQTAVVIVHHTSKGNQADKGITDVGSGAGAISRAADTHMTIRDHEEPGYQVLEAVTRSFPSPDPISIYFKYPLWYASDLAPKAKTGKVDKQAANDKETREAILELLKGLNGEAVTTTELHTRVGFGKDRTNRGVAMLARDGLVTTVEKKNPRSGKMAEFVVLAGDGLIDGLAENPVQSKPEEMD